MKAEARLRGRRRLRGTWVGRLLLTFASVVVVSCAAAGPDSDSETDLPFATEMSEILLGTESGNPTSTEMELGTESGNPIGDAIADPENGTESGNPTRPPPPPEAGPEMATPDPISPDVEPQPDMTPEVNMPIPEPVGAIDPGVPDAPDAAPTVGPTSTAPSPAGNPGVPETPPPTSNGGCDPAQCQLTATQFAASVGAAQTAPAPFEQFACTESGSCLCESATGVVELVSGEMGCLVPGTWSCLLDADEFLGCDESTPMACEASCGQLLEASVADAMGRAVEVRSSACVAEQCRFVLVSDDACFLGSGGGLALEALDCSLTDEELLAP